MSNVAARVIQKFGGVSAVAELLKCDVSRVHRWTYPKERGGTGGTIPQKRQTQLLQIANVRGVSLTPADFFDIAEQPKPRKARASA